MKKTYISPNTTILKIGMCQMVCVSGVLDKNQEITEESGFGSRRHSISIWDDDDE